MTTKQMVEAEQRRGRMPNIAFIDNCDDAIEKLECELDTLRELDRAYRRAVTAYRLTGSRLPLRRSLRFTGSVATSCWLDKLESGE